MANDDFLDRFMELASLVADHAALCEAVREWAEAEKAIQKLRPDSSKDEIREAHARFLRAEQNMLALANK